MAHRLFLKVLLLQFSISVTFCILRELTNLDFSPTGKTSGVAISDLDSDGTFEIIVSVLDGPNKILKYDTRTEQYYDVSVQHQRFSDIRDETGRTISVCACDMDGDGTEEIYIHNSNDVYPVSNDVSVVPDKLFSVVDGEYQDLFSLAQENVTLAPRYGGYSVACIDRTGTGTYDVIVTTFTKDGKGTYKVFSAQMKKEEGQKLRSHVLTEISEKIGLDMERDGRGILVGPLFPNKHSSSIFITNDNSYHIGSSVSRHDGRNVFLKNKGDGTFEDVAVELGLADRNNNGRGSVMGDFNADGKLDLVFANWLGPSRVFQQQDESSAMTFQETEGSAFSHPAASDVLLTADFDNDGQDDILKSGANGNTNFPTYNEIFTVNAERRSKGTQLEATELGSDEKLKRLRIRGIAVADLNRDGILELFVSHDRYKTQTFSVFQDVNNSFNWIRFLPLTKYGSFARGSFVTLTLGDFEERRVVIGGECSFMCQSEPVAHFGIGRNIVKKVEIIWPDGHKFRTYLFEQDVRNTLIITYSGNVTYMQLASLTEARTSAATVRKDSFVCIVFILILYIVLSIELEPLY